MDIKAKVPISETLTAAGVVIPFGDVVDPGVKGSGGGTEHGQSQFTAQDEQIVAVQYYKLRYKWFAKNKVENLMLAKKACWERYDRPRYLESDIEDMIEVKLDDDVTFEGDREECTVESGEIFVSAPHDSLE